MQAEVSGDCVEIDEGTFRDCDKVPYDAATAAGAGVRIISCT